MANTYVYDGKEFHSIKRLAAYTGIHEKTLTARLRKGMTVEEACQNTDLRCRYFEIEGEKKSISQIAQETGKDKWLLHNRLRYGYDLDTAISKPKKNARQGVPITVCNKEYKSIKAAIRDLDLEHKESTIYRKLKSGMDPAKAFAEVVCEKRVCE